MGLKQWVTKAFGLRDAKTLINAFGDFWGLKKSGTTGYVAACVDTMGWAFSKAKFRLYRKTKGNLIEQFSHPFLDILDRPNSFQQWSELKYFMGAYFGVKGNYYLLIQRGLVSNKPLNLIMLDPMRVKPITANGKWIDHYEYRALEKINLQPEELIHLRMPSINSFIEGRPIIDRISEILDVDALQMAYMKKFYEEGGFLGQIFSTNAVLSTQAFNRALEQLSEKYAGTEKAFKVALFEQGLQPLKSAYSIKDMELNESRRGTLEEVMTAFKIPKILLGGSSDSYVKASADAAMKTYADMFLDPILNYIDEVLTDFVRREWEKQLVVKHDSLSPKDVEGELAFNKGYAALGALTINEIRTSQDYDPLPYELCDVPILNVGGAAIDLSNREQIGTVPNNKITPKEPVPQKSFDDDFRDMKWKQFDRRYQRQIKLFGTKVGEYFDDQQKRLLEVLDKKNIGDIENFFNSEEEYLIFKNLLESELIKIMQEGYSLGKPGTPFNLNDEFVRATIISIIEKARSVNDTTKAQLINYIKDRANLSNSELALLVKEKFQDIKESRVNLVVTTTVTAGMNAGLLKSFKDAGAKFKIWLSMRDIKVRDTHLIADNQKVEIDKPFIVNGEPLDFPGDPKASVKQVANCRCTLLGEI